eukprot:scaffold136461_cov148-Phaeocystis_antarctica.AAC.1
MLAAGDGSAMGHAGGHQATSLHPRAAHWGQGFHIPFTVVARANAGIRSEPMLEAVFHGHERVLAGAGWSGFALA